MKIPLHVALLDQIDAFTARWFKHETCLVLAQREALVFFCLYRAIDSLSNPCLCSFSGTGCLHIPTNTIPSDSVRLFSSLLLNPSFTSSTFPVCKHSRTEEQQVNQWHTYPPVSLDKNRKFHRLRLCIWILLSIWTFFSLSSPSSIMIPCIADRRNCRRWARLNWSSMIAVAMHF